MAKRPLPPFIPDPIAYERWLNGRAIAHVKRDKGRGHTTANPGSYRAAIHQAVIDSGGRDFYTGEELRWDLCGTYSNELSKTGRHHYKATLAMMPTVDHHEASSTVASFKICAWRTNDAKNDMNQQAFIAMCRAVVAHADGIERDT